MKSKFFLLLIIPVFFASLLSRTGCGLSESSEENNENNTNNENQSPLQLFDTSIVPNSQSGSTWIYGKVKNTDASDTFVFVKVTCDVYGSGSNLIKNVDTYVVGDVMMLNSINTNTNTSLKPQHVGF